MMVPSEQIHNELILNAAGEGIFGLDLEGRHTFVNPAAAKMLGYDVKALLGEPSHSLWHHTKTDGSAYPPEECPIYGAYKNGHIYHGDKEVFWRKDGSSFPAEYTSTPITDGNGHLIGAVVTFRDITARFEAAQTIAELRRHNKYVLDSAGEGIFGLDLEGRHTFVNPAAATMLGYDVEELLGQPSHSLWHHTKENGSHFPHEDCPIYGAYKDGLVHVGEDELFWRKDGSSFTAQYCSTPMRNDQGQLIGAVVTFQDVTERKRLAVQLMEAAKLAEVTKVLGNVGHDIKNMLMPVMTGNQLLTDELNELFPKLAESNAKEECKREAVCMELTQMIGHNAKRIHDQVREIADAVKGVTSEPHFVSCQVDKVVEGVKKSLHVSVKEKDIALHVEDLHKLPPIQADEKRIFTALYNLISNAIPEISSGGSITVTGQVDDRENYVELVVTDTGKGMPPEVRERLFTKNAISTKSGGTGLGTKIVKDAIDAHHGSIRVESTEGVGTSFYIQLPIDQVGLPKPENAMSTEK